MAPQDDGSTTGHDAARILAGAGQSSERLQGAVSVSEGWWTIASAALLFVIVAGALRVGHGVGPAFVLVLLPGTLIAKRRQLTARVHPRKYRLWYAMAVAWSFIVLAAGSGYWVLREPPGTVSIWLTSAAALVAAIPLAVVGARLVASGQSR